MFLSAAPVSLACGCTIRSLSKRKAESRNVFAGKLISRTQESKNGQNLWRNQFAIEHYWKGANIKEITVYTTLDDCGSWFELGQSYLVFAYFVKEGQYLETDSCMGTGRIDRVAEELKELGKGRFVQKVAKRVLPTAEAQQQ